MLATMDFGGCRYTDSAAHQIFCCIYVLYACGEMWSDCILEIYYSFSACKECEVMVFLYLIFTVSFSVFREM